MKNRINKTIAIMQEFSIPLIMGVLVALIWANISYETYYNILHYDIIYGFTLDLFVNDIFMVLFFALAVVQIVKGLVPGGDLYPVKTAVNPLMATFGGVLGPAIVFIVLNYFLGSPELSRGWGIPTATDIALAWLVARVVFGTFHPAVSFLLLLAVVDDGIGLAIIAIFYPDPSQPVAPVWLLLTLAGMLVAFLLNKAKVSSFWPYVLIGGTLSWFGLHFTSIHPALALVFIVPFLPHHPSREVAHSLSDKPKGYSTISVFEHTWQKPVDFGLFLFGFANAGVQFSGINIVTWFVFFALLIGKTTGIFLMGSLATKLGFPLPTGMGLKELFLAGLVAAVGLTVALFVAGVAYLDLSLQGAAKMGALLSVFNAAIAITMGKLLKVKRITSGFR